MMMQMLDAGGMPTLSDHVRKSDDDNPKGYYEFEPVKKTAEDPSWLAGAVGKAVKMVYKLLYDLPETYSYRVVMMRRKLEEVLASQSKMIARTGGDPGRIDDRQMAALFRRELQRFDEWVAKQKSFTVIDAHYHELINAPEAQARRISEFLGDLDVQAMAAVVDPQLYRNRK